MTTNGSTLKAQDEDLVAFAGQFGAATSGTWTTYLNGTAISGMGVEDLSGAHVDPATGDIYAIVVGSFKIGGVSGNDKDILKLHPDGGGYTATTYWRGPDNGFNFNIGGVEMP